MTNTLAQRAGQALRSAREDRAALVVALVMAAAALGITAVGLSTPENGGVLRYAPYASLVLAPIVAAVLVLAPWSGLCLWILLMAVLNIARVELFLGPVQIILSTVLLVALVAGTALQQRRAGPHPATPADRTTRIAWAALGVLALLAALSTAVGPSLDRSAPIVLHGMYEPLALVAVTLWLRPSRRQIGVLLAAMGASVALAAALNLVRMLLRYAQTIDDFAAQRAQLAKLTYFNVGILGDMLVMALPLLVGWLLLRRQGGRPKITAILLVIALAVSLFCLYVTFSKSGWLGAILALGAFGFLVARRWPARVGVTLATLVLVSFVIPYPSIILKVISPAAASTYNDVITTVDTRASSIDPTSPTGEVSVTERILATKAGLRMAIDHPLLGVGPGGFAGAYAATYHNSSATRELDHAHDLLAYVAAEFGFPAALLVAAGLFGGLLAAWLAYRQADARDRWMRIVAAAVIASLGGFVVVASTFGMDLYRDYRTMNSDALYAALLVATAIMLPRIARESAPAKVDEA